MKKAQFAALAVISFLLSVMLYVILWPLWSFIIETAQSSIDDPFVVLAISALPVFAFFMLIMFLINSLRIRGA